MPKMTFSNIYHAFETSSIVYFYYFHLKLIIRAWAWMGNLLREEVSDRSFMPQVTWAAQAFVLFNTKALTAHYVNGQAL